ncbi:Crp/Fnr family transcriptional regulator [Tenacibaculum caenipelagi]|uniref:CRP-like cAMP-binding protein n=1 Tax=Tenacibaculum caenipelagi TaxID=1325435 RepID=A0A4R6TDH3_9FLAO|nr:Crp/Fnr family transcriptional regulator [Tenacibaculum caenipelagi]TDQ23861.1 CRP-like cAMP-binding protein [Tenacibaculum caenipelagi]
MNQPNEHKAFLTSVFNRYATVSDDSISSLFSAAKIHDLKKGTTLLPFGKISKHVHVLYKGAVVSCFLHKNGTVYHKNIFLSGSFIGSVVSSLTNTPSQFSLEVIEDSTVISFPYDVYRQLIKDNQDLQNFYIAYLEKNWVIDKEKREIDIVLKEAKERYLDFVNANPNIENRIPLHYIASHLGITPTQLSRIRKSIKKTV